MKGDLRLSSECVPFAPEQQLVGWSMKPRRLYQGGDATAQIMYQDFIPPGIEIKYSGAEIIGSVRFRDEIRSKNSVKRLRPRREIVY